LYNGYACTIFSHIKHFFLRQKKSYRHNRYSISLHGYYITYIMSKSLGLCSDRVMFSDNTGAKGGCEGEIQRNKRADMRGDSRAG
jgi:hypothetical protein